MKKQQLEQSQQQQINNTTTPASTQILVPKTLDQASAQFAASALVTTDKLLGFKSKEDLVLAGGVNGVLTNAGVFKNLHLTSAAATLHQTNQSTHTTTVTAQTFLQPSSNSNISTPAAAPGAQAAAALGLLGCSAAGATPTTTQVLIGNNICLSVQSAASLAGRHIPRTLGNMPASALKLSTSTNLSGASSMDLSSRDNHDEDKPALNSLADNTVAMEVT
ncbi:enhancer of polycomb homolog 1 [Nematolebias whitei]|uniref:enhancer of polycomb homolog 1 n=1 Tax=Nematolebias whitei TaxID=451745 RepID=UPI001897EE6B|nr:enhancer of polycomb homolog 1 [Nematolebias whitei]